MKQKIILFLALMANTVLMAQNFTSGGINYTVTSATAPLTVAVGLNSGFVGEANIPETVTNAGNTYAVTAINQSAFQNAAGLTSVTIPNSVTTIGPQAFRDCTSLTSVTIPNSVTTIGSTLFRGCTSLASVTIPDSVTSIGESVFFNCTSLVSVTIPNSVTTISSGAFWNCTGLTSVTIGNSVTTIGVFAFRNCTLLSSVTIPNSVTTIGFNAFQDCTALTSVTIGNSVTTIGTQMFFGCTSLASVTIPNSVTTIGLRTFQGCTSLASVIIPDSVTEIGQLAFLSCTSLTSVTVNWTSPITINANVFQNVAIANVALNIPTGTLAAYQAKAVWQNFILTAPAPVVPTFNAVNPICGGTNVTLPTTSTNGIVGTWSPSLNNMATTTYTFTPNAGQNATTTTLQIVVNVTPAPTASSQSFCGPATVANLVVSQNETSSIENNVFETSDAGPVSTIKWYNVATQGTALSSSTPLATGTYYVSQIINNCESARTPVSVTVNVTPAPTSWSQEFCGFGTVANLVAVGSSHSLRWYLTATSSSVLENTTALSTGTYYVSRILNNCESARTAVNVTVNTTPAPLASSQVFCNGATVADLVANGTALRWYDVFNEDNLGSSSPLVTGTYYVSQTLNNCESTKTPVSVTVNITALPVANANQNFAAGATLADVAVTGSNLKWYDSYDPSDVFAGYLLGSNTLLVNGTTYYVAQTINGCESAGVAVTITISSSCVAPTLSTVTAAPACLGNTITIVLSGLIPNTAGVATYTVGNSGLVTQAGTSNANGMFSFTSPATANLNGLELSITKITTTAGCETSFTDKKVTLVVTPLPTLSTVTAAPTCAGSAAMVVLSGLNPNTAGIATYKVGGGPLVTQAGTSDANGTFSFPTNLLPADANGVIIEITKLAILGGCVTNFTDKKVTLVVNRCVRAAKPVSGKENALTDGTATVILYPNPASDVLNIEASLGIQSVEILNNIGQRVLTSTQKQINVSDLPSGVYLVRIQDLGNNVETKKVIIK